MSVCVSTAQARANCGSRFCGAAFFRNIILLHVIFRNIIILTMIVRNIFNLILIITIIIILIIIIIITIIKVIIIAYTTLWWSLAEIFLHGIDPCSEIFIFSFFFVFRCLSFSFIVPFFMCSSLFSFKFDSNHSHQGFASFCIIWLEKSTELKTEKCFSPNGNTCRCAFFKYLPQT